MHSSKKAQIAHLKANKALTLVSNKYANFVDVFIPNLVAELPAYIEINNYAIEFVNDQQLLYGLIYSLGLMELETLKTYIKNNLANSFIRPSKSPTGASIFFNKKPNNSLKLCIDYRGFNNLTIKNWYLLPLVRESLNWLGWAWRFTQLDLTNSYHQIKIIEGNE